MKKRLTPPKESQAPCDEAILPEQPDLFPNTSPIGGFAGTRNPRLLRAIRTLLRGPVMRERLDRIAGASNGPELVRVLRRKGLQIPCKRLPVKDRDGRDCRPGQYQLTDNDRRLILAWQAAKEAAPC